MRLRWSVMGWLGAAGSAAMLLTGAAALAITAMPRAPMLLDLGQVPPAALTISVIAEAAPQAVPEVQAAQTTPAQKQAEQAPAPHKAPARLAAAPPSSLPKPKVLAQSDMALPADLPPEPKQATQKPDPKPQTRAKREKPKTKPEPKPQETKAKNTIAKPDRNAAKPAAPTAGSAPKKGNKANGGASDASSAAYAKAVLKKVRSTRKKLGAGKGVAVVGFTVSRNGGLAGVKVIRSSGDTALDQIAVSHIQRAAPFPPPPEGAGRSFSFEFVGK